MESIHTCGDSDFGPQVTNCRGGFDFTLLFEEVFLSVIPSSLFLLALWFRYQQLRQARTPKVFKGSAYWAKLIFGHAFGGSQLSLLVVWALPNTPRTKISLLSAVMNFVTSLGLLLLSHLEHLYCLHPSHILNIALSASLLFDVVRLRSLWLASYMVLATIYTVGISLKITWFALEARSKRASFINEDVHYGTEELSGLYSRLFFWWLNPLFFVGFKKSLSIEDLPPLDQSLSASRLKLSLASVWVSGSQKSRNSLVYDILWVFKSSVAYAFTSRFIMIALNYSQPFLIARLIRYVETDHHDPNVGYGLIAAFLLVFTLKGVLNCLYQHSTFRLIAQIRGAIVPILYDKTLDLKFDEYSDSNALTLMDADIENIASGVQNMHEVWASVIEVSVALYLLQRQVSWAAAVPAVISGLVFFFTHLVSKSAPGRQKNWMEAVRVRIAFTSSYLDSCIAAKMLGLLDHLSTVLQKLRVDELELQKKFRHLMVKMNLLAGASSNLGPVLTVSIYTGIALHTGRKPLTAAETFTALSIIALVSSPLANLVYSGPRVTAALESLQRIQSYLMAQSREDDRVISNPASRSGAEPTNLRSPNSDDIELEVRTGNIKSVMTDTLDSGAEILDIQESDIGWNRNTTPTLLDIDLRLSKSSFTVITGPVGSGKSTLLKAILGEVPCLKGRVSIRVADIAFCDARSWTRNRSIRDNICEPLLYDERWFQTVLHACALDRDLDSFLQKDLTIIGTNGVAISGGQRQRIAIARAIYSRKPLAIFDDVFSALDSKTVDQIFERVFGRRGILRQHGVTVLLTTHGLKFLPFADHAVVLQHGRILEQGPPRQLHIWNQVLSQGSTPDTNLIEQDCVDVKHRVTALQSKTTKVHHETDRMLGDMRIYNYYLRASGTWLVVLYFTALGFGVFCSQFPNLWVQWWAEENSHTPFHRLALYICVYTLMATLGAGLWAFCMWLVFCRIVPKSSIRLHAHIVMKVKEASLHWLTSTDNGVTLNRFSQDMTLVDRALPADFLKTSNNLVQCIMSAVFICIGARYMAPLIPLSILVIYCIQKFYLRTSRQLRHLDLEAKSPLYTHFTETLSGLVTIRAFGWQRSFQDEHEKLVQVSQRPYYILFVIQRWLILVLDLFVAGIATTLVILAVFVPRIGPVGVSLISLITFNQQLSELINFWTSMETSIGAVARIRDLDNVPSENLPTETRAPPSNWPSSGELAFEDMAASSQFGAPPILRNISLKVPAGEKLGICGRTGSGKSSLILTILRLLEIQHGDITLDGVSLQSCPRDLIRSRVTVIPQAPVLFRGTVRDNVTGFTVIDDGKILAALGEVQLRDHVEACGGLAATIDSLPLSDGQRQLLSLARAILMKRKVLLLDEVTSRVDRKTEELMQAVIRREFANCTIIAVAHRAHTLLDFDRIAVIDDGRVVEYDTPNTLLRRPQSVFRQLYERHQAALSETGTV